MKIYYVHLKSGDIVEAESFEEANSYDDAYKIVELVKVEYEKSPAGAWYLI